MPMIFGIRRIGRSCFLTSTCRTTDNPVPGSTTTSNPAPNPAKPLPTAKTNIPLDQSMSRPHPPPKPAPSTSAAPPHCHTTALVLRRPSHDHIPTCICTCKTDPPLPLYRPIRRSSILTFRLYSTLLPGRVRRMALGVGICIQEV